MKYIRNWQNDKLDLRKNMTFATLLQFTLINHALKSISARNYYFPSLN